MKLFTRLLLSLFICATDVSGTFGKSVNEPAGPDFIIRELETAGAFKTPGYELTSAYDAFRKYDNLQGLFFDGLSYHDDSTKVFCWYGVPENLSPGEKVPAVVLVHGGGGSVYPDWVKKWTDRGYAAISIALEGQVAGERDAENNPAPYWPTHEYSGPCRTGFFQDIDKENLEDQWFFHAVADVILAHSLIRTFDEIDTTRIGITGISWGGILGSVIPGIDKRFAFAVPVYGCGYLQDTPTYSRQMSALSASARNFYLDNWEPSNYLPRFSMPTLYLDGSNDCHFSMNALQKSYNALQAEKYIRIEHNMPHGHVPGWRPEAIYHFADYVVSGGEPPTSYALVKLENDGKISFGYTGDLYSAQLLYTTDTADWECDNYVWLKAAATISAGQQLVTAQIPKNTQYFIMTGTTPGGVMYSSPMHGVDICDTCWIDPEPVPVKFALKLVVQEANSTSYVSGALVSLDSLSGSTNVAGEKIFLLDSGNYRFTLSKSGYFPVDSSVTMFSDTVVFLRMHPTMADVKFRVKQEGAPVVYADVSLNGDSIKTGSIGLAYYEDLPVFADYSYTISKQGYETVSGNFYLEKDTTIDIQMSTRTMIQSVGEESIRIYPVPADNYLILESDQEILEIRLLDLYGRLLFSQNIRGRYLRQELPDGLPSLCLLKVFFPDGSAVSNKIILIK